MRVFATVPGATFCVCDYMFPDESRADVRERFKEMLDCDIPEETMDTSQETTVEKQSSISEEKSYNATPDIPVGAPKDQKSLRPYIGAAMAAGIALLATAVSLLYLGD